MKNLNETDALDELIIATEQQRAHELALVKEQFHVVYESFKPINLIKKTVHDVRTSPEIKTDMLNNAIGLGTGLLSKKLLVGKTHNPIKRVLGSVVEYAVAKWVSKHTRGIASIGSSLLNSLMSGAGAKKEIQNKGSLNSKK